MVIRSKAERETSERQKRIQSTLERLGIGRPDRPETVVDPFWTEPNILILGNRGSGKTVGLKCWALNFATLRKGMLIYLDRPGSAVRDLAGHFSASGFEDRTWLINARDVKRTLQWPFISEITSTDPVEIERDESQVTDELMEACYGRRNVKSGETKPYTTDYAVAAIKLFARIAKRPNIRFLRDVWLPSLLPMHEWLMGQSLNRNAVSLFRDAEERRIRSPADYEISAGAGKRLLQPLWSSVIYPHDGNTISWEQAGQDQALVLVDLSGVSFDDARSLGILIQSAVLSAVRRHFYKTGKPLPVTFVLEECGRMGFATPAIIGACQEMRQYGVSVAFCSQTHLDFSDETAFEQIMGLCQVHIFYHLDSGIERCAADLANPQYDPMREHSRTKRAIPIGQQVIETFSKGERSDGSKDERIGQSFVTQYEYVEDVKYMTADMQEQQYRTDLSRLETFERFVKDHSGVRREKVIPLRPAWALGLSEDRTEAAIQRILSRPEYQPVNDKLPDLTMPPVSGGAIASPIDDELTRLLLHGNGTRP